MTDNLRDQIYKEIEAERSTQESVWTKASTTTKSAFSNWQNQITDYAAKFQTVDFKTWTKPAIAAYRSTMVKTAAFAVATIETIDKQG